MQTAKPSGQFENSVLEIRALWKIHTLLQDVLMNPPTARWYASRWIYRKIAGELSYFFKN